MADRYWVGGTASWDGTAGTKWALTSGGAGGQDVPTSADDVFFDAASGANTVTIASGNTGAKSINCTGFTGTINGSTAITVSGSITLVAGMTYTHSDTVTINGTGTLTTAGKTFSTLTIDGAGITVTLGDNLNIGNRDIELNQGTFTTSASNYSITARSLYSETSSTRTLTLNGSTVTLTGTSPLVFNATGITFNANTSLIDFTNSVVVGFDPAGLTFYNVSFTNTAHTTISFSSSATYNNLTFAERASAGTSTVTFSANQTVNGTFSVQAGATNPAKRVFFVSNAVGTAITITSASNSIFGADFRDITGAGVASWDDSSRTGYWGNCTGNSGITFATGRTVYWNLAGAQNWSATGWAATSTGTPNAQYFPLAQDTATFTNAGSVTGTISIEQEYKIGSIDMSGRTSAMTLSSDRSPINYGNWTNGSGTTLAGIFTVRFEGRNTQTITSAGRTFAFPLQFTSLGGTIQLSDALVCSAAVTLTRGIFNASNQNFTALTFNSSNSNTRTITMGSGLWTLTGTSALWTITTTTNLTFNKDTANILLSNTSTSARTFAGGGLTYNNLTIGGTTGISTLTFTGSNTFNTLSSTKTVAHTILFTASTTNTFTTFDINGTSGNLVTIGSATAASHTLAKAGGGTVTVNYLSISRSTATPTSTWTAINSTDGGNNSGWTFSAAPILPNGKYFLLF